MKKKVVLVKNDGGFFLMLVSVVVILAAFVIMSRGFEKSEPAVAGASTIKNEVTVKVGRVPVVRQVRLPK
jgi:hypothetical protein